ncbi:TetR-like C-terminal domain-containing protein [Brachybacterium saurashtrense]|uniref:TetR-like C-terminal domain-containing protein n=1 Tax=Brachybacterium saurashtrense TaxID=556288 RepID=UPI001F493371|nr:TetR-like C-terminal domain-containing protein [Brachybacterium saurashtrense]
MLEATGRVLLAEGLGAVTFDRVSTLSGASRTTLYKWWPSPGALAAEAYFASSEETLEFPDTGDLLADTRAQLRAFVGLLTGGPAGRIIAELIGAAQQDPELFAALSALYTQPRRALARESFERARRRGQLRADVDADLLVDQLWGACYHRLLTLESGLDVGVADALVHSALLGAASPDYRARLLAEEAEPPAECAP